LPHVLVTGANGHVGNQIAAELVEHGYRVRAMVRRVEEAKREIEILRHPAVEVVGGDIRDNDSVTRAVTGCEGVFHVAAVYAVHAKDPQRDIIDPAVLGALNVLQAAKVARVRRVVLTSSLTAIGNSSTPKHPLDESQWNDAATEPYARAKTLAERQARAFADESGLDLVSINPTMAIGPGFSRHTPSTQLFDNAIRGLLPILPPLVFTFVDVRDVAIAHRLAFERPEAKGRYLCGNVTVPLRGIFEAMHRADPNIRIPRFDLPRAFFPILPAMDWLQSKWLGTTRLMTAESLKEYAHGAPFISNARICRDLGWKPRSFNKTVRDTLVWIRAHNP
jgi:dihydroflavonol-4-reductase